MCEYSTVEQQFIKTYRAIQKIHKYVASKIYMYSSTSMEKHMFSNKFVKKIITVHHQMK
jgi:hypothetical protein